MSFFKRKQNGEISKHPLEHEKEILGKKIAGDVDQALEHIQSLDLKYLIEEKIQKLRYLYPDINDYKYELLKRNVYYIEFIKELKRFLAEIFRGFVNEVDLGRVKQRISGQLDEAVSRHYDRFHEHYLSTDEGLQGLEQSFRENLLMYEWLKKLLPFYQRHHYSVSEDLPKRWIVRRIEEECKRKTDEVMFF
ncbi:hypothetical protein [Jeotgalibacillus haloalkalitolerans]|uniref:Uncharacterized protein n=1 Tax=Jeotgalibacillus haloalkalitolerans TaxID=3104292 RepID=A0ABU5KJR8_9BACL|nr:hypothetical protein [Jeotgalibacillus sp. HH7-29]MDZ5711430.1 hypothetical protein [Jeotgalibacillus sp. HH7-29]